MKEQDILRVKQEIEALGIPVRTWQWNGFARRYKFYSPELLRLAIKRATTTSRFGAGPT
jgi:hypothetical protein